MIRHPYRTILGDCPDDWAVRPLRELIDLPHCQSGDWGNESGEVAVSVLRSTNFTNDGHIDLSDVAIRFFPVQKADVMKLQKGDILLERSGGSPVQPVGRVLIIDRDMPGYWFSNFIHCLRPNPNHVIPGFLKWVLYELHHSGVVERLQNQTTQMRNLELRDYFLSRMPVPEKCEQRAICGAIDAVDAMIAHSKALIGITGSLRRDNMGGVLNRLKDSLLSNLVLGRVRIDATHQTIESRK